MDFGDILRILIFIIIPILVKTSSDKKKINEKNKKRTVKRTKSYPKKEKKFRGIKELQKEFKGAIKSIEDIAKEARDDLNNNKNISSNKSYYEKEEPINKDENIYSNNAYQYEEKEPKASKDEIADVITKNEIGKEQVDLDFSKQNLIKGIIFSEVLSKPKSMQKSGR